MPENKMNSLGEFLSKGTANLLESWVANSGIPEGV